MLSWHSNNHSDLGRVWYVYVVRITGGPSLQNNVVLMTIEE